MLSRLDRYEDRLRRRQRLQQNQFRQLVDRTNPLEAFDTEKFKARFHLSKATVIYLVHQIHEDLSSPVKRGSPLPPLHQLLIALNYYATNSFQLPISDNLTVQQPTVCRVIRRVSSAIAKLFHRYIKFPSFAESALIRQKFYGIAQFPGVIGAIDCTLIRINSPGGADAELFRCRKGYFAINVQAICNADLNFTNLVARWYGSAHDARIFDNSHIKYQLEQNELPSLLLGDAGYPLLHYLMTPLSNPNTQAQRNYNKSQIKTRCTIERSFGIWKKRFPCLNHLRLKISTALTVIVAVAILHNISRKRNDIYEEDFQDDNFEPIYDRPTTTSLRGRAKQNEIISSHFT